jgi:predicted aspartyl protease
MSSITRNLPLVALLGTLLRTAGLGQPNEKSGEVAPTEKMAAALKNWGYKEVPLTLDKAGCPMLKVEVEGTPMLLLLDTGANALCLDRPSAKRAGLTPGGEKEKGSATGSALEIHRASIRRLSIGGSSVPAEAALFDYSAINALRKRRGEPPSDGILGGQFLTEHAAVIDYPRLKLYLLDSAKSPRRLGKLLKAERYAEVPVILNNLGLLDVGAEVLGESMLFLVDTGADAISLDRASARRAKLAVKDGPASVGAAGEQATGRTTITQFSVGGIRSEVGAVVMDFAGQNLTRKQVGDPPCDGCLDSTFLTRRAAVIDYGGKKLYVRKREAN